MDAFTASSITLAVVWVLCGLQAIALVASLGGRKEEEEEEEEEVGKTKHHHHHRHHHNVVHETLKRIEAADKAAAAAAASTTRLADAAQRHHERRQQQQHHHHNAGVGGLRTVGEAYEHILRDESIGSFRAPAPAPNTEDGGGGSKKQPWEAQRILESASAFLSPLLNVYFVTNEFWNRPARDPSAYYNLSILVVLWVEVVLVHANLAQLVVFLAAVSRCGARKDWYSPYFFMLQYLEACGQSVLRTIAYINPSRTLQLSGVLVRASQAMENRWLGYAVLVCSVAFFLGMVGVGVVALAVKLTQLRFVIESHSVAGWGFANTLAYAGFVNQVASVGASNPLSSVYEFVFDANGDGTIDKDEQVQIVKCMQHVTEHVVSKNRLRGFLWMLTYSISDMSRIFIQRRQQPITILAR